MKPIRLEDDFKPTWQDAETRLKVAAKTYGFPFTITLDEVAYAYKDMEQFMIEDGRCIEETAQVEEWWDEYADTVHSHEEAIRVLYPWFHDGEKLPNVPSAEWREAQAEGCRQSD